MKREYLIIILVVVGILAMCGCAAGAAFVLLPNPFVGTGGGGDWSQPRQEGQPITPANNIGVLDVVQGQWQCAQVSSGFQFGTGLEFLVDQRNAKTGYMYPSDGTERIKFAFKIDEKGELEITPWGGTGIALSYYAQFPDMNTMLLYSTEKDHKNDPPAVFQRMQQ
jgi:hypothetical protein